MLTPSLPSMLVFLSIVASVVLATALATWRAMGARATVAVALVWGGIMGISSLAAPHLMAPLFEGGPPRALLFFVLLLTLGALSFRSAWVGALARATPLWALVLFQAFRLPLELLLHEWFSQRVIPQAMTYSGQNIDIIAGALALPFALALWRGWAGKRSAWVFLVISGLLLLNVLRVVIATTPSPLRSLLDQPPLLLATHPVCIWIASVCVLGSWVGHVVLLRALIKGNKSLK